MALIDEWRQKKIKQEWKSTPSTIHRYCVSYFLVFLEQQSVELRTSNAIMGGRNSLQTRNIGT